MKKGILAVVTVLAGLTIAGCADNTVASTTAGKISEDELYDFMKENIGTVALQQLILEDVLNDQYGDTVTEEAIDEEYNSQVETYGGEEQFELLLTQEGMTTDTFRSNLQLNLLVEAAVKDHTEFTDEEIQTAYDDYVPAVTAAHILVEDEETAADLIEQLNDGADFAELAAEYSIDEGTAASGGEVTFTTGEMVTEFEEAAFALEEGEITQEPVSSTYGYHVIQMIEKPEKGTLEEEREGIEEDLMTTALSDSTNIQSVLSTIMQDANIIINDEDLSTAMDGYLQTEDTEDSSSDEDTSSDEDSGSDEDTSSDEDSSTE